MPSCLAQPPQTAAEWFALVDRCAQAAGGPAWQSLALTGLLAVAVAALAVLALAAVVWWAR